MPKKYIFDWQAMIIDDHQSKPMLTRSFSMGNDEGTVSPPPLKTPTDLGNLALILDGLPSPNQEPLAFWCAAKARRQETSESPMRRIRLPDKPKKSKLGLRRAVSAPEQVWTASPRLTTINEEGLENRNYRWVRSDSDRSLRLPERKGDEDILCVKEMSAVTSRWDQSISDLSLQIPYREVPDEWEEALKD